MKILLLSLKAAYGTLRHNVFDDTNLNYVLINEEYQVATTCGTNITSYVERVTFDFVTAPQSGAQIWLYAMSRDGDTSYFYPTNNFLIPTSLIQTGSTGLGIQTVVLNSTDLPITAGQYFAAGFNSKGGSCYQIPDMAEYYLYLTDAQFATLANATYTIATGGSAHSFDVRTIGVNSP